MRMDEFTNPATLTGQPAANPFGLSTLSRACPVCGNSDRQACIRWCAIPELEVLRCRRWDVTFSNKAIDDNFGFGADREVAEDPALAMKAANDFRRLKENLAVAALPHGSPLMLLDAGCGMGTFLMYRRWEGWKAIGLELSPA